MRITVAYVTNRANPQFAWFVDSLFNQTTPEQRADIQLVVVDGHLWHCDVKITPGFNDISLLQPYHFDQPRLEEFQAMVSGKFDYTDERKFMHVPPKPCAFQGPFRQTKREFFCAGNARDTALIVAEGDYVVFCDDLSVLAPTWYSQVLHAAQHGYVVAGVYQKHRKMVVENGQLISSEVHSVDDRWPMSSASGIVPWNGSIYGCSWGLPLEAALEVDGHEPACYTQGGEDYDVGIRLHRAGWQVFINRNMLSIESEEHHHDGSKLPQERKLCDPALLPQAYSHYRYVKEDEKFYSDHVLLNRLYNESERITPLIGNGLGELRRQWRENGTVPIPAPGAIDWRDGKPLSEL